MDTVVKYNVLLLSYNIIMDDAKKDIETRQIRCSLLTFLVRVAQDKSYDSVDVGYYDNSPYGVSHERDEFTVGKID